MRYLVTGGCGFIGSHLVERLLAAGNQVTVLDDLSTGSLDNLTSVSPNSLLSLFIDSVLNRPLVDELVDHADRVFHLAAAVGVRTVMERPVDAIRVNVEGTGNVLAACAARLKKVLLTSTSEVYGKNERVPFQEDDDLIIGTTVKSRWGYACAKALDEFLAFAYARERGLPAVVVRLFNTVGPRQSGRYGMVIPRFVAQALAGKPITVFGDGSQTRCFIHVKDVVDALCALMEQPAAVGSVFNVGSQEEVSIMRLAEMVKKMTGSSSPIVLSEPRDTYGPGFEDMSRRVPDTSRLRRLTGFSPTLALRDIIADVIADQQAAAGATL